MMSAGRRSNFAYIPFMSGDSEPPRFFPLFQRWKALRGYLHGVESSMKVRIILAASSNCNATVCGMLADWRNR